MLKKLGWLAASGASALTWSELISRPAKALGTGMPIGDFVIGLVHPLSDRIYSYPFQGWAFLASSLAIIVIFWILVRSSLRYMSTCKTPLSVLATEIDIFFDDETLHRNRITRTQYIHANKKNVTAYRSYVSVTQAHARIEKAGYEFKTIKNGANITDRCIYTGGSSANDIVEIFKEPLRTNFLVTYLPNEWVNRIRNWFPETVVNRHSTTVQTGEYDMDDGHFALHAVRYPVTDVSITIHFPSAVAPAESDIFALLTSDNAAIKKDLLKSTKDGLTLYTVKVKLLVSDSIILTWENIRLRQWKAARAKAERAEKAAATRAAKAALEGGAKKALPKPSETN